MIPAGQRTIQIHLVDTESHELVSGWLIQTSTSLPLVTKTFDIQVSMNEATLKKIMYTNPWDSSRKYVIRSSDETLMKPRYAHFQVEAHGDEYLRLWFAPGTKRETRDLFLFINDASDDQNEECLLIRTTWS